MVFLFLGFPSAWDKGVAALTGLIIIILAYRGSVAMRMQKEPVTPAPASTPQSSPAPASAAPTASTFVENKS